MEQGLVRTASLDDNAPSLAVVANNAGVLPTDVLLEVLLRLPADELCRLRLVCRSWRSLTCDALFADAHSSRHAHVVALQKRLGEILVLDLLSGSIVKRIRVNDKEHRMVYMSLQHDLVIVSPSEPPRQSVKTENPCVFSLVTGSAVEIPHASIISEPGAELIFPPRYILGHVSSTGEHKILCIAHLFSNRDVVVSSYVTTLVVDTRWRVTTRPPVTVAMECWKIQIVGGMAFFLEIRKRSDGVEGYNIALFDFATEQWRTRAVQGPPAGLTVGTKVIGLSRLGSCLVAVHSNCKDSLTDLWFLDWESEDIKNNSLWTKRYTLRNTSPLEHYGCIRPLLVLRDGRIVTWMDGARIVRAYDPRTSTWTDMAKLEGLSSVAVYQGSLLRPSIHTPLL